MIANDLCILIPYYNDGEELKKSLSSINVGTLMPGLVVIVDDGSDKIKAEVLIRNLSYNFEIKVISLLCNQGIENALNQGLVYCIERFDYIARLDCGDVNKKERLYKQYTYMKKNSSVKLLGTWVNFFDVNNNFLYTYKQPKGKKHIKKMMYYNAAFTHPSVMFRSDAIKVIGMYPTNRIAAEDYALFFKFLSVFDVDNLQEPLVDCLVNPKGISVLKRKLQLRSRIMVQIDNFDYTLFAFFGLIRSFMLYITPRSFTVKVRSIISRCKFIKI